MYIDEWRRQGGRGKRFPPPLRNPGKYAKDGEQYTPQPAVSRDIKRKLKIFVNVNKNFLKLSKYFNNFLNFN